jgi:hypothetical protein
VCPWDVMKDAVLRQHCCAHSPCAMECLTTGAAWLAQHSKAVRDLNRSHCTGVSCSHTAGKHEEMLRRCIIMLYQVQDGQGISWLQSLMPKTRQGCRTVLPSRQTENPFETRLGLTRGIPEVLPPDGLI